MLGMIGCGTAVRVESESSAPRSSMKSPQSESCDGRGREESDGTVFSTPESSSGDAGVSSLPQSESPGTGRKAEADDEEDDGDFDEEDEEVIPAPPL